MSGPETLCLVARTFGVERSGDVLFIGLANDDAQPPWQLTFMDTDSYGEQELELGQDTYCIVSGDQAGTVYGGVLGWTVAESVIDLHLSAGAATKLGLATRTTIRLDGDARQVHELIAGLQAVLGSAAG